MRSRIELEKKVIDRGGAWEVVGGVALEVLLDIREILLSKEK